MFFYKTKRVGSGMKKLLGFLIILLPLCVLAQGNRGVDGAGNLVFQYSRTTEVNPQNAGELVVTFIFVNGNAQQAITYRQERAEAKVRWISTPGGSLSHETVVDAVTANLAPGQGVVWRFAVPNNAGKLEPAAIMMMREDFGVEKIMLE